MKTLLASIIISVFTIGALGFMADAEAKKRFGGGKSSGMQRDSVKNNPTPPAATPAPPAATPGIPAAAPAAAGAAAAKPAASGMSKWMGPLAGLAAGGILAAMFMGGAFDGIKFFDIILMVGLAIAVFMLVRMFMRKKAAEAGGNQMQYAGHAGRDHPPLPAADTSATPSPMDLAGGQSTSARIATPEIGSRLSAGNASPQEIAMATDHPRIPADFDVAPFERNSKAAFIRLQAANDAKDLNDIREFTTPEMFAEISLQMQERGAVAQKTEVVSVDARVIEVIIETHKAVASVRYTGVIREEGEGAEGFDEVWHVVKDLADANSTWKLAGIQQLD